MVKKLEKQASKSAWSCPVPASGGHTAIWGHVAFGIKICSVNQQQTVALEEYQSKPRIFDDESSRSHGCC